MTKWRKKKAKFEYNESDGIVEKLAAINGIEDINRFVYPTSAELHDPYLLKNIVKAAKRILEALKNDEEIVVHADVDYDGAVSTAIMFNLLKRYTNKVRYIHSQRSIGHGIYNSIEDIPKTTKLLIIVDSSSNEVETCRKIRGMGIDVIILDHHEVDTENDQAILVNPMQNGCEYPNKNTSGSLICWKMIQVLDDNLGDDIAKYFVDLAGTGVHSDQCSMLEYENRYVLLEAMRSIHNVGMKAILKVMDKDIQKLTASDIAYSLTPFVNAGTRFDKMEWILELLTTDDFNECLKIAKRVKELNDERKIKQAEAVQRLIHTANLDDKCMVFIDGSLGKGFNGLIAADLAGHFKRPVVVLGESEDKPDEYHGSFRSIGFFDFLKFTGTIPETLYSGGHPGAGGLGIKKKDLESLRCSLNEGLAYEKFEQVISYDLELQLEDVTESFIQDVKRFYHLSGKHFSEARFLIKDLFTLTKTPMANNSALKTGLCSSAETWFIDEEDMGELKPKIDALKFRTNEEFIETFPIHTHVDVIGTININEYIKWKPRKELIKTLQIFIDDYRKVN